MLQRVGRDIVLKYDTEVGAGGVYRPGIAEQRLGDVGVLIGLAPIAVGLVHVGEGAHLVASAPRQFESQDAVPAYGVGVERSLYEPGIAVRAGSVVNGHQHVVDRPVLELRDVYLESSRKCRIPRRRSPDINPATDLSCSCSVVSYVLKFIPEYSSG